MYIPIFRRGGNLTWRKAAACRIASRGSGTTKKPAPVYNAKLRKLEKIVNSPHENNELLLGPSFIQIVNFSSNDRLLTPVAAGWARRQGKTSDCRRKLNGNSPSQDE